MMVMIGRVRGCGLKVCSEDKGSCMTVSVAFSRCTTAAETPHARFRQR